EICFNICYYLSFQDLTSLRQTSQQWHALVSFFLRVYWNAMLKKYVSKPGRFRNILRRARAVVSGSTVLQFILRQTDLVDWEAQDLDIYCPSTTGSSVVNHLMVVEGYILAPLAADETETGDVVWDTHKYNGAIRHVTALLTPSGRRVDVITAIRNSPTEPMTQFWTTLVCNYMSADSVCITYPRTTFEGVGYINPLRANEARVRSCMTKYSSRGFDCQRFDENDAQHTDTDPLPAHCPATLRSFQDAHCLRLTFDPVNEATIKPIFPLYLPAWTWGGDGC
ncbi:hypothetical protein BV25DRAFT_1786274, partial [Artomyces pyxidatus]